jgi:hypothetical protein
MRVEKREPDNGIDIAGSMMSSEKAPERRMAKGGSMRIKRGEEPLPSRRGLVTSNSVNKIKSDEMPPDRGLSKGGSMRLKRPIGRGPSRGTTSMKSKRGEMDPERKTLNSNRVRRDYKDKLEYLEEDHKEELETLKTEYEENLKKLNDLCIEKDQHIANYGNEIQRFHRLPNSLGGKLITTGPSNGQAGKMPEIGRYEKDGYLLASKKGGGQKYAVFYYKYDEEVE